jgi:hypothetical protein
VRSQALACRRTTISEGLLPAAGVALQVLESLLLMLLHTTLYAEEALRFGLEGGAR